MKDFLRHLCLTAIYAFLPITFFLIILLETAKDGEAVLCGILPLLPVLIAGAIVHSVIVGDERESVTRELTKDFGAKIIELQEDLADEKFSKHWLYQECESAAKSAQEASNAVIADLQDEIRVLENKLEELSKNEVEHLFHEAVMWLFPENFIEISPTPPIPETFYTFAAFYEEICRRIEIASKCNDRLTLFENGLNDFRCRPYIYTTLADSVRNRLIVDCVTGEFAQNEAFPVVARVVAELQTTYLDTMAMSLMWGNSVERAKKVTSLRELKKQTKNQLEAANFAKYQLEYLLGLYPQLQDVLDVEYKDLDIPQGKLPSEDEHDTVRDYLSREEYAKLTESERNQLALDRYIESRKKSKWQVGRDYELYIGYLCEKRHCRVEYTGSTMKLEDLGRDLIVSAPLNKTYIIQCKYWSKTKTIHEKHIAQLFGTLTEYNITHNTNAEAVFVTSTALSDMAHRFAEKLNIKVYENVPLGDFPRIKCNINRSAEDGVTYIYHLPIDFSYDVTKIENAGEFMAFTVKEAEQAGFRRSYKWSGAYGFR